jgi:hypothetical protein
LQPPKAVIPLGAVLGFRREGRQIAGQKGLKDIVAKISPNLTKYNKHSTPNRINSKNSRLRHILIKLLKTKDKENSESSLRKK